MPPRKSLILGGAQIGQSYGLVRSTSFADGKGIQELFDAAKSCGFSAIDTARTYGHSEEFLGRNSWDGQIHTKLDEYDQPSLSLSKSLEALRRESVDLLYVCHDASRVSNTSYDYWQTQFENLGEHTRSFGAAVYSDQLDFPLLEFAEIQSIQIPFNIFSPLEVREKVKAWKMLGKKVYARSIFAQGLLLEVRKEFAQSDFSPSISALHEVARILEIDAPELAFRWVLNYPDIEGLIMGISRLEEIESVCRWFETGPLLEEDYFYVEAALEPYRREIDLRKL